MADHTRIEWTDATWNPITGCSVVSPGCTNCYAMRLAGTRLQHHPSRAGLTQPSKAGPVWTGKVRLNEQWLDQPLRWRRPRRIFVCAHGDLFHESVPDEWIDKVFAVMALAPQHIFQVLTKRAARMRQYCNDVAANGRIARRLVDQCLLDQTLAYDPDRWPVQSIGDIDHPDDIEVSWPLPNIWFGVSAEDQHRADERLRHLRDTPAAARWISAEPLLGPITADLTGIHWVVAGGESGLDARPMHPDWARSLRDQCVAAGVPFFFKQWGEWREFDHGGPTEEIDAGSELAESVLAAAINPGWVTPAGRSYHRLEDLPEDTPCRLMERVGKTCAGALLDGREWREMPGDA